MATEDKKKAVDLGLLEEDDEFEEFPVEEWDHKEEDQTDVNVWEDNWDDDTVEDDFSIQLSKFSRKRAAVSHSPPLRSPEPVAKKICSRLSPPEVLNGGVNGNGKRPSTNGHHACGDVPRSTRSSSRTTTPAAARGGNRRSSPSNNDDSSPPPSRTTRSSARLRSSRK